MDNMTDVHPREYFGYTVDVVSIETSPTDCDITFSLDLYVASKPAEALQQARLYITH